MGLNWNISWVEETASTNSDLKGLAKAGTAEGLVIAAARQTAGRGRLGRSWHSSGPWGLWASFLIKPDMEPERAPFLGMLAAAAAALAIKGATGLEAGVKWPNDVEYNGLKLCGVLPEAGIGPSGLEWVVIGLGMNLSGPVEALPEDIRQRASTVEASSGVGVAREAMLGLVLNEFSRLYDIFVNKGPREALGLLETLSTINGEKVDVISSRDIFPAVAVGTDDFGALLVRTSDGELVRVLSGEVSIRRMKR